MAESKAELIAIANDLRRHADHLKRKNRREFCDRVHHVDTALGHFDLSLDEREALLPSWLTAEAPHCRLTPLADHVVIRPADPTAVSEGGIIIPENAKEVPMRGEVLAVGPGRIEPGIGTVLPAVQVGQDVLFGRYAGVEVTLDGEELRIMREEDILGILAPESA